MKYRIGLDLGIESVGWAVIEHNEDDEPAKIVNMGVRMFDAAEVPKTGESLNKDRRTARGGRRLTRRRYQRMNSIRNLIFTELGNGSGKDDYFAKLFDKKINPIEARVKALSGKLADDELAVALYHIARHRGFKSNRKTDAKDDESGKVKKAIEDNKKIMSEKKYVTVAEFLLNEYAKNGISTRNKSGEYTHCVLRLQLEQEVKIIFEKQREYKNLKTTQEFEKKFLELFNKQRNFDEGPDYHENDPNKDKFSGSYKIGYCQFEPVELRAPKNSFSAEYFKLLQDMNNLNVQYADYSKKFIRDIAGDKLNDLVKWCLNKEKVTFGDLRKKLELSEDARFNTGRVQYFIKKKKIKKKSDVAPKEGEEKDSVPKTREEIIKGIVIEAEKSEFCNNKGTHSIKKALGSRYDDPQSNIELYNEIARIVINAKSEEKRIDFFNSSVIIQNANLNDEQLKKLLEVNFDKVMHLSIVALNKIIPHLEEGLQYWDACSKVYGDHAKQNGKNGNKNDKIKWEEIYPDIEYKITSPVCKRTISQTIKVVNAIIDKYGSPSAIFIEMTREMKKNFDERRKIKEANDERASENEKLMQRLKTEFGLLVPKRHDIVKLRLYEEQSGKCAYCGASFENKLGSVSAIFNNNNTQVDHIVPYSMCFDDSYNNKVICCADCNQDKRKRLPYEAFGCDTEKWAKFEIFVNSREKWSEKKKRNCFRKQITDEELKEMGGRAINDTSTIANTAADIFRKHLHFTPSALSKKPVRTVNGIITSYLRKIWELNKNRDESDKHHGQDAVVIACTTNGMIQNLTRYFQNKDRYRIRNNDEQQKYVDLDTGELMTADEHVKRFAGMIKEPYINFKSDVNKHFRDIFVSRMPNRKVKGQIHEETIRSSYAEPNEEGMTIVEQRVEITELKLKKDDSGNLYIDKYSSRSKETDPLTYNTLLNRLKSFYNDGEDGDYVKKAFKEAIYKTIDGKPDGKANQIKKVKTESVRSGGFKITKLNGKKTEAIADNGGMIRIDVFKVKVANKKTGSETLEKYKYYWIPVYVADYYAKKLPNKVAPFKNQLTIDEIEDEEGKYVLKNNNKKTEVPCEFCFSLYKNDLVHIKSKTPISAKNAKTNEIVTDGVNDVFVYYNNAGIATGSVNLNAHDKSFSIMNKGIQDGIEIFEKYEVDILGNISKNPVKEKRQDFK